MTDTHALITVVVPVYNGSATLEKLVERTLAVFTIIPSDCEILLVNDGSTDASWKTIEDR